MYIGTHWLSEVSTSFYSNETLFPTCFQADGRVKIEALANADLKAFFKARQQDTNVFLGLVNMIKSMRNREQISFTAQSTMRFMDHIFCHLLKKRGVIPFFYRFSEEFLAAATEIGYHIDRTQDFIFPCDYVTSYQQGKITREQLSDSQVKMARAWSEGSISYLLDKDLLEDFYSELYHCFQKSPEIQGSNYHLQFLILSQY